MSLIIPTIFFFLLNFSFTQITNLDLNCNEGEYYNSLNYECSACSGIIGIYNDTCYSGTNAKSIYTFEDITTQSCGTN